MYGIAFRLDNIARLRYEMALYKCVIYHI
jgi:hypothetical protein